MPIGIIACFAVTSSYEDILMEFADNQDFR